MSRRTNLVLLTTAIVLALISTAAILRRVNLAVHRVHQAGPQSAVVIATQTLPRHSVIGPHDVRVVWLPTAAVTANALRSTDQVVGRFSATTWLPGQQILSGMVANSSSPQAFALTIPKGEVAFTIPDDPIVGVDHLISPGDRVNVLVTYASSSLGGPVVRTVLQNVRVLHVDLGPQAGPGGAAGNSGVAVGSATSATPVDTVTLAVTPAQSAKLDFAYVFGQLHLALRNPS